MWHMSSLIFDVDSLWQERCGISMSNQYVIGIPILFRKKLLFIFISNEEDQLDRQKDLLLTSATNIVPSTQQDLGKRGNCKGDAVQLAQSGAGCQQVLR
jgi:hypothetical protein